MLFLTVDGLQNEVKMHCDGKLSMLCRTHLEQEKLVIYLSSTFLKSNCVVTANYNRLQHVLMQLRCWPAHSNNNVLLLA